MNHKSIVVILFIVLTALTTKAQKATIDAPAKVDSFVEAQIQKNIETKGIHGFRIQILQSSDRAKVNLIKKELLQENPDLDVYILYQAPNYKVRVGNYLKRIDCYSQYRGFLINFPQSFIVSDIIELPEL